MSLYALSNLYDDSIVLYLLNIVAGPQPLDFQSKEGFGMFKAIMHGLPFLYSFPFPPLFYL